MRSAIQPFCGGLLVNVTARMDPSRSVVWPAIRISRRSGERLDNSDFLRLVAASARLTLQTSAEDAGVRYLTTARTRITSRFIATISLKRILSRPCGFQQVITVDRCVRLRLGWRRSALRSNEIVPAGCSASEPGDDDGASTRGLRSCRLHAGGGGDQGNHHD